MHKLKLNICIMHYALWHRRHGLGWREVVGDKYGMEGEALACEGRVATGENVARTKLFLGWSAL